MSSLFIQSLSLVQSLIYSFIHYGDLNSASSTAYYSLILKICIALLRHTNTHSVILTHSTLASKLSFLAVQGSGALLSSNLEYSILLKIRYTNLRRPNELNNEL